MTVVLSNFHPFEKECMEIYDVQENGSSEIEALKSLIDKTDNKYIDVDILIDVVGDKLPKPYTLQEVRDIKIKLGIVDSSMASVESK